MSIGRLHAYLLRRLSRGDALAFAAMTALAIAVVVTGRIERSHLRPRAALEATAMITDLDVPRRLPNVALTDGFGEPRSIPLWQRVHRPRAVVTFYAPWCGPCQRELPALHRTLGEHADILVVVSADEDLEECKRKLANLGLEELGFLVDTTGELTRAASVTALPTAFAITPTGAVLGRSRGFSYYDLARLSHLVAPSVMVKYAE